MLYTKDNDILQSYMILQWWISLVFLSNRTQAAGSKYLLDLYQSMCHIYKVIFSLALGRKANAALDFCLQGLKSFTLDSCHPPPLTQDLSCTEECLFICCCCCTATKRGGKLHGWGYWWEQYSGNWLEHENCFLKINFRRWFGYSQTKQRLDLKASPFCPHFKSSADIFEKFEINEHPAEQESKLTNWSCTSTGKSR